MLILVGEALPSQALMPVKPCSLPGYSSEGLACGVQGQLLQKKDEVIRGKHARHKGWLDCGRCLTTILFPQLLNTADA